MLTKSEMSLIKVLGLASGEEKETFNLLVTSGNY